MKTTQDWHDEAGVLTCSVSHELLDEKGRDVGAKATIVKSVSIPSMFYLCVAPTRNGQIYGSTVTGRHCGSIHGAQEQAEFVFAAQGKRYAKKYGARDTGPAGDDPGPAGDC